VFFSIKDTISGRDNRYRLLAKCRKGHLMSYELNTNHNSEAPLELLTNSFPPIFPHSLKCHPNSLIR
jgi:hypothetical protein